MYGREHAKPLTAKRRKLAAVSLAAGMAFAAVVSLAPDRNPHDWTRGYPPCATEDAPGPCYWDAQERGNGRGRSFIVEPRGHDDDVVIYVER